MLSPPTTSSLRAPAAPSIGWSLMLIGIFIAASSALSIPFVLWRLATVNRYSVPLGGVALISSAAFLITAWIATLLSKRSWRELTASPRPARGLIVGGMVMAAGMMLVCSEVHNWTLHLLPVPAWLAEIFAEIFNVKGSPIGAFLALAVVAPVTEEFICRRWLLESLLQRLGPGVSIAISAVTFGLMHLNPWQFVYATVLGVGIGWLYWRSRSVWLCILWHAANNGMVFVFNFWPPNIEGFRPPADGQVEFQPIWLTASGLALLIVGTLAVALQARTQWAQTTCAVPIPPVLPPPVSL